MISAGLDIGSTTTKAVLIEDNAVRAALVVPTGTDPAATADTVLSSALAEAGIKREQLDVVVSTGYGRRLTTLSDMVLTEIKACALGVASTPVSGEKIRTVIDVGGQDTKVIALDDSGDVDDFSMNDKCAAGTGRFLEMLAHKLGMCYEEFVAIALESDTQLQMNATCAVFAESEVVGLLARNVSKADIAAAAHHAIAARIGAMIRRVARRGAYGFVGGGARNNALVKAVCAHLNAELVVLDGPQTVVALGAAVGGARRMAKLKHQT